MDSRGEMIHNARPRRAQSWVLRFGIGVALSLVVWESGADALVGLSTASDEATRPAKQSAAKSARKEVVEFRSLFGEVGESAITAFTAEDAQAPKILAECSARLGSDAAAVLEAWSKRGDLVEPSTKPARKKPKASEAQSQSKHNLELIEQSAPTWQLARIIAAAPDSERSAVANSFLAHPQFARTLALVVKPENEDLAKVLRVARSLMAERSEVVDRLPELAAAVSVVGDSPILVQVNGNLAQGCGSIETFDHFVRGERRMLFGLSGIAPELLIYVVDIAASQGEMEWALEKYAGHRAVGELYDEIEYDFDHLEKGRPLKSVAAGWSLANILRYGGVCADQTYFSTVVGKSIGVPCAYTVATDGVLAHAWIGFVRKTQGAPTWDEIGRYGGYQSIEGFIRDPQTGDQVSSTQMPMLLHYGLEPVGDRLRAAALRIAARHLLAPPVSVTPNAGDPKPVPTPLVQRVEQALALVRGAVDACLTDVRSWELVGRAAATGAMTLEQKQQWSSDILDLCGDDYPEFAWRTISPMVNSIEDVAERQKALDWALTIFADRGDLAGQLLLQQAALYKTQGNAIAAGRCYEMILDRYANDGPFAIVALQEASKVLAESNDARANVVLHERAFHAMEVPIGIAPHFAKQSNWYRAGVMLAHAYRIVGRERDAGFLEGRMTDTMK